MRGLPTNVQLIITAPGSLWMHTMVVSLEETNGSAVTKDFLPGNGHCSL